MRAVPPRSALGPYSFLGVNLVPNCADCAGFDGDTGSELLCRLYRKLLILHGMEEVVGSIPTRSTKETNQNQAVIPTDPESPVSDLV